MRRGPRLNRFALTELRERSGLTKSAFARAVAISAPHMTDLEAGRRQPSPELMRRMADILKVPMPALMYGPDGNEDGAVA